MEWTESYKQILLQTAKTLKGVSRRRFMAQIVLELGYGGQSKAEQELGWNRGTLRKGILEVTSGIPQVDNYHGRGRKKVEWHLPNLLLDIQTIVDCNSQTDPSFKTKRLYTRLSARQVREELMSQYNYPESELPSAETIRQKLNQLGYYPQRVAKTKPQKKFPKPM
ncbi:MAG: ISAzo13-like element transposase-related protein, partial [Waterburya sp.]